MEQAEVLHRYAYRVSFGDCDPAGIVYYPNIYKWVDTAFHDYLYQFGGHAGLCEALGSIGIGLMETSACYRVPLRAGDRMEIALVKLTWARKSLTIAYRVEVSGTLAVEVTEVRGLFQQRDGRINAADMGPMRARMSPAV